MKSIIALILTALLSIPLALAAPASLPCNPRKPQNAISAVTLRRISSLSQHYSHSSQNPSTSSGELLTLLVGQSLSLDHAPLHLQAIEIVEISEGKVLGGPLREVKINDRRVVCKALLGYSIQGPRFGIADRVKGLGEGVGVVEVTGLECDLRA